MCGVKPKTNFKPFFLIIIILTLASIHVLQSLLYTETNHFKCFTKFIY